ncbi:hypothetical protein BX616_006773, partial [Lobosporangium transversale]
NIRRRVYDALNILEALGIISMDKKEIHWIGILDSKPIREVSRKVQLANPSPPQTVYSSPRLQQRERDGADESEEPEDDEMEIEQLQKEVEAMKLRNALELARLQDQVARHVQVNNLIERNKLREEKELERQLRRRQRKQERKEEKRAQALLGSGATALNDGESMDVQDDAGEAEVQARKSERRHRHHRHRSPRIDREKDGEDAVQVDGANVESGVEMMDEETARKIRKQERRERRERKEKRAQRRLERESAACGEENGDVEQIQLPFVGVKIPRYAGQSSDSEASISVVRRVREEQRSRKSGKSKKQGQSTNGDETTMVEIKIPHQEELSIISDTEILGDLGLNQVPLNDLKAMLPEEAFNKFSYTTTTTENGDVIATVQGGFERAI